MAMGGLPLYSRSAVAEAEGSLGREFPLWLGRWHLHVIQGGVRPQAAAGACTVRLGLTGPAPCLGRVVVIILLSVYY